MINSLLQWAGTAALMIMYCIMSFAPELHPLNLVCGFIGGALYLTWSYRERNRPQQIVNLAGMLVCVAGLIRAWG